MQTHAVLYGQGPRDSICKVFCWYSAVKWSNHLLLPSSPCESCTTLEIMLNAQPGSGACCCINWIESLFWNTETFSKPEIMQQNCFGWFWHDPEKNLVMSQETEQFSCWLLVATMVESTTACSGSSSWGQSWMISLVTVLMLLVADWGKQQGGWLNNTSTPDLIDPRVVRAVCPQAITWLEPNSNIQTKRPLAQEP